MLPFCERSLFRVEVEFDSTLLITHKVVTLRNFRIFFCVSKTSSNRYIKKNSPKTCFQPNSEATKGKLSDQTRPSEIIFFQFKKSNNQVGDVGIIKRRPTQDRLEYQSETKTGTSSALCTSFPYQRSAVLCPVMHSDFLFFVILGTRNCV